MDLRRCIQSFRLRGHIQDSFQWSVCHRNKFDTSFQIRATDALVFCDLGINHEAALAWCKLVLPRAQFLAWLVSLRKIHTRDRLVHIGVLGAAENICPLCMEEKETDGHLLIHCRVTYPLWLLALRVWNISMVLPNDPACLMVSWLKAPIRGKFMRNAWKTFYFATISTIWSTRNNIIFEGGTWDATSVTRSIKTQVGHWMKLWNSSSYYAPSDIERVFEHLFQLG